MTLAGKALGGALTLTGLDDGGTGPGDYWPELDAAAAVTIHRKVVITEMPSVTYPRMSPVSEAPRPMPPRRVALRNPTWPKITASTAGRKASDQPEDRDGYPDPSDDGDYSENK